MKIQSGRSLNVSVNRLQIVHVTSDEFGKASIWFTRPGNQDITAGNIDVSGSMIFGPYLDDARFRIDCHSGEITVEELGKTTQVPVLLSDHLTMPTPPAPSWNDIEDVPETFPPVAGVAVADATDETDIVAQFNALLASLRTSGAIGE